MGIILTTNTIMDHAQAVTVLDFWLGSLKDWDRGPEASPQRQNMWWHGSSQLDATIAAEFGCLLESAAAAPEPVVTPQYTRRQLAELFLAQIIVLSQFARNIHRGPSSRQPHTKEAFAHDATALRLAKWVITEGLHEELRHYEKQFLYFPFVHSEVLTDQDRAVQLFAELHDQAVAAGRRAPGCPPALGWFKARRAAVAKFGRIPWRNVQLGRESTPQELVYLRGWSRGCA